MRRNHEVTGYIVSQLSIVSTIFRNKSSKKRVDKKSPMSISLSLIIKHIVNLRTFDNYFRIRPTFSF